MAKAKVSLERKLLSGKEKSSDKSALRLREVGGAVLNAINDQPREVADILNKFGAGRLKFMKFGSTTLTFDIGNGLVAKFALLKDPGQPVDKEVPSFVNKPLLRQNLNGLLVSIEPKLRPLSDLWKTNKEKAYELLQDLWNLAMEKGYEIEPLEFQLNNAGLLSDGKPVWMNLTGYTPIDGSKELRPPELRDSLPATKREIAVALEAIDKAVAVMKRLLNGDGLYGSPDILSQQKVKAPISQLMSELSFQSSSLSSSLLGKIATANTKNMTPAQMIPNLIDELNLMKTSLSAPADSNSIERLAQDVAMKRLLESLNKFFMAIENISDSKGSVKAEEINVSSPVTEERVREIKATLGGVTDMKTYALVRERWVSGAGVRSLKDLQARLTDLIVATASLPVGEDDVSDALRHDAEQWNRQAGLLGILMSVREEESFASSDPSPRDGCEKIE